MTEPQPSAAAAGSRRWGRWLVVGALLALALAWLAVRPTGQGTGPRDERAARLALEAEDVAPLDPAAIRPANPPVDVAALERGFRAATLGRAPLPESRQLQTYVRSDTGEEVTHAVLLYDDPSQAASLDRLAAPLLGSAFGLESAPLDLAGAEDSRRWTGQGYQVATFRVGGAVMVVATTAAEPARLEELAVRARDKALAAPAATPTTGP